jgi:hypothetical protein
MHPAALDPQQLLVQCDQRFTRRSGPGGQRRHKVETAVVLTHRASGIQAEANERRSREANRTSALFRLRVNLALAMRTPIDTAQGPSPLWERRVRNGKLAINPGHDDFPALLAEALDVLAACDNDVSPSAEFLGVTASQFVKLLKLEPRALAQMNAVRLVRERHALR